MNVDRRIAAVSKGTKRAGGREAFVLAGYKYARTMLASFKSPGKMVMAEVVGRDTSV